VSTGRPSAIDPAPYLVVRLALRRTATPGAFQMMIVVFAAALVGLVVWTVRLQRTPAPIWAGLVALVPVCLGVWCLVTMAGALVASERVSVTLAVDEQVRQVAMHDARTMRWGMRFCAAALVAAGWLLFVMWRWEAPSQGKEG
jgi:hypothetical protein